MITLKITFLPAITAFSSRFYPLGTFATVKCLRPRGARREGCIRKLTNFSWHFDAHEDFHLQIPCSKTKIIKSFTF